MARRNPNTISQSPTYKAWTRMWSRVRGSANAKAAKNYRDRGIRVCDRWRTFSAFLADMGAKPVGAWLDRIDNDRDYSPDNCRWASPVAQQRNRRTNVLLTHNGETLCVAAWAERAGIHRATLRDRLLRGWSVERAVTTKGPKEEVHHAAAVQ